MLFYLGQLWNSFRNHTGIPFRLYLADYKMLKADFRQGAVRQSRPARLSRETAEVNEIALAISKRSARFRQPRIQDTNSA